MTIPQRTAALREAMKKEGLDGFVVFNTDPHQNEYISGHWKGREWFSGFTGSAGVLAVTGDKAGLWTDSRYFLQAERQLEGSGIILFREGEADVPAIQEWLFRELGEGGTLGIPGDTMNLSQYKEWGTAAEEKGVLLKLVTGLLDRVWEDRPEDERQPVFIHPLKYAGESTKNKLKELREQVRVRQADAMLISAPDEVAWVTNLRGRDIAYNPLFMSYLLIQEDKALLFIDPSSLSEPVSSYLRESAIETRPYGSLGEVLAGLKGRLIIDPSRVHAGLESQAHCRFIPVSPSPAALLKSIKNGTEIENLKQVMVRDGKAMARFLSWLNEFAGDEGITEISAAKKLAAFRAEEENFVGESFDPIVGYRGHGAIVHYSATPATNMAIKRAGLLLIDSGGQYLDGTTDITRTVCLSTPREAEIRDYTMVLKAHIALAAARFPRGTKGYQLDAITRKPLWDQGLQYGHGTGHGVGSFLNVHEGPQRIAPAPVSISIAPGMLCSNEPGLYRQGVHGIRIENLILCVRDTHTDFGEFYKFETLSLCPLERQLIDPGLLTRSELNWVNAYQDKVKKALLPHLSGKDAAWLEAAASPVS